jgi:hypothetical protein
MILYLSHMLALPDGARETYGGFETTHNTINGFPVLYLFCGVDIIDVTGAR